MTDTKSLSGPLNTEIIARDDFISVVLDNDPALIKATRHFLTTKIANRHSRDNYSRSVIHFLTWCFNQGGGIKAVTPEVMGHYRDHIRNDLGLEVPTVNNKLSGISRYFRALIQENAIDANPADKTERPKFERDDGTTPEIPVKEAAALLQSIDTSTVVGLRDRAVIGVLAYTALRVGAVADIRLADFKDEGNQFVLSVTEKRGRKRKLPVRHNLQAWIHEYIDAAGMNEEPGDWHLFRSVAGKTKKLRVYTPKDPTSKQAAVGAMTPNHMHRMLKRRLKDAGLSTKYSCHSFRVAIATDLFKQGVDGDDIQYLLGHKDRRTTALYNRKEKKVTRNLVERISI